MMIGIPRLVLRDRRSRDEADCIERTWPASPFVMEGGSGAAMALDLAIGLAIVALSLRRGRRSGGRYGGWNRAII